MKAADKDGAVVFWQTDLKRSETFRHLFTPKLTKTSLLATQKIAKETIQDRILSPNKNLSPTAHNHIIITSTTSVSYTDPKVHKSSNQGYLCQ